MQTGERALHFIYDVVAPEEPVAAIVWMRADIR
jgi:hypothetical protein